MLQDKTVLLGICACTPAYKALDLIAMLKRKGADVKTAVTENGTNMVPVAMLERMSGNPVSVEQFGGDYVWDPDKKAWGLGGDVLVIAPCTANMIGKLANGIADDSEGHRRQHEPDALAEPGGAAQCRAAERGRLPFRR